MKRRIRSKKNLVENTGYIPLQFISFRCEKDKSRWCYVGLLYFTFSIFAVCLTGVVLLFIFYTTGGTCALPKFVISFNLILCIGLSALSIMPFVQERMPRSGLLQAALISGYVIYLTWSALTNNPDKECNPSLISIFVNTTKPGEKDEVCHSLPSILNTSR